MVNTSGTLQWLADVLREGGLSVVEVDGWKTRGHGDFIEVRGIVGHGTAGAPTGNYPSLATVRDGRPDLAGPLANLGLGRDGTVFVIAAGVAWHAGDGVWPWLPTDDGNWYSIGIEAETVGTSDDWTPAQLHIYPLMCAVLLHALGLSAARFVGHKEYSSVGKPDPAFWPGDMAGFRTQIAQDLADMQGEPPVADALTAGTKLPVPPEVAGYFGGTPFVPQMNTDFKPGTAPSLSLWLTWCAVRVGCIFRYCVRQDGRMDAQDAKLAEIEAKLDRLLAGAPGE